MWFEVLETKISPDQLSDFDEAFFVWTAAEVTLIWYITDRQNNTFEFATSKWEKIKQCYMDIVRWNIPQFKKYIDLI